MSNQTSFAVPGAISGPALGVGTNSRRTSRNKRGGSSPTARNRQVTTNRVAPVATPPQAPARDYEGEARTASDNASTILQNFDRGRATSGEVADALEALRQASGRLYEARQAGLVPNEQAGGGGNGGGGEGPAAGGPEQTRANNSALDDGLPTRNQVQPNETPEQFRNRELQTLINTPLEGMLPGDRRDHEANLRNARYQNEDERKALVKAYIAAAKANVKASEPAKTPEEQAAAKARTEAVMARFAAAAEAGRGASGQGQATDVRTHTEYITPAAGSEGQSKYLYNGKRTYSIEANSYMGGPRQSLGEVNQNIRSLFGRDMTFTELGDLVGAPAGSTVKITKSRNQGMRIDIENPLFETQYRDIRRMPDGTLDVHNSYWKMNKDAPNGIATHVFAKEVAAARQLGVDSISVHAAGDASDSGNAPGRTMNEGRFNGYYTWARLGYDNNSYNKIPADVNIPRYIQNANGQTPQTMNELMSAPGGPEFWRQHGSDMYDGYFNVKNGSVQLNNLRNYLNSRGDKTGLDLG